MIWGNDFYFLMLPTANLTTLANVLTSSQIHSHVATDKINFSFNTILIPKSFSPILHFSHRWIHGQLCVITWIYFHYKKIESRRHRYLPIRRKAEKHYISPRRRVPNWQTQSGQLGIPEVDNCGNWSVKTFKSGINWVR